MCAKDVLSIRCRRDLISNGGLLVDQRNKLIVDVRWGAGDGNGANSARRAIAATIREFGSSEVRSYTGLCQSVKVEWVRTVSVVVVM